MEAWRHVWRNGFAPLMSTRGLRALRDALAANDPRLLQGATTLPPPFRGRHDGPVESACALGFCGWHGEGLATVGEVDEFFVRSCVAADERLGEHAACRYFLNWFDETPRDVMRNVLLDEVTRTLAERVPDEDEAQTDEKLIAA